MLDLNDCSTPIFGVIDLICFVLDLQIYGFHIPPVAKYLLHLVHFNFHRNSHHKTENKRNSDFSFETHQVPTLNQSNIQ